jgi:hypothetical protein
MSVQLDKTARRQDVDFKLALPNLRTNEANLISIRKRHTYVNDFRVGSAKLPKAGADKGLWLAKLLNPTHWRLCARRR